MGRTSDDDTSAECMLTSLSSVPVTTGAPVEDEEDDEVEEEVEDDDDDTV